MSRRQLLHGTAIVTGAAAVVMTAAGPAEARMSAKAAGYQGTPKNGEACSTCALFKVPNTCTLVDGDISPNGWCRFYAKKS